MDFLKKLIFAHSPETNAIAGAPVEADDPNASGIPIKLDDVRCQGTETSIFNCTNLGWGNHNCETNERAKVTCVGLKDSAPDG